MAFFVMLVFFSKIDLPAFEEAMAGIKKELGKEVDMQEVQQKLKDHLKKLFDFQFVNE